MCVWLYIIKILFIKIKFNLSVFFQLWFTNVFIKCIKGFIRDQRRASDPLWLEIQFWDILCMLGITLWVSSLRCWAICSVTITCNYSTKVWILSWAHIFLKPNDQEKITRLIVSETSLDMEFKEVSESKYPQKGEEYIKIMRKEKSDHLTTATRLSLSQLWFLGNNVSPQNSYQVSSSWSLCLR